MLNTCIDILATLSEMYMLYILFKKEQPVAFYRLAPMGILYFLLIRSLTMLGFSQSSKLILILVCNSLLGHWIFKEHFIKSIILGFLHLIAIYIGELSVQSVLVFFYEPGINSLVNAPVLFAAIILLTKIISIICCMIFKKLYGNLECIYNWKLSFCILFPLTLILWSMAKLQELIFSNNPYSDSYDNALLGLALLVSIACLLYIYRYYFQLKELQLKRNFSEKEMLATFGFYENRLLKEENNRRLYHDLQMHMTTLEKMLPSEQKTEYAAELLKQLKEVNHFYCTGVETIDIVLNEKQSICNKKDIKIICIGDFTPLNRLKPIEIVTIFHNAIENAIQEYEKNKYPDKIIEITCWTFHQFINIRFMNYYMKPIKKPDTEPSDLHGFGISNMQAILERYHGEAIPSIEDDRFYMRIIIPLLPGK